MPTPWRRELYRLIATLNLAGSVIDLGGSRKSGYHELIRGSHTITVANMDEKTMNASGSQDLRSDLEKPLNITAASYDSVLAFNVFEHVFNYEQLVRESYRILKQGGSMTIGVPFLISFHPSPHDYWRYTEETLALLMKNGGFSQIKIKPVGRGPFTASAQLIDMTVRFGLIRFVLEMTAHCLDSLLALAVGHEKLARRYPLGYYVTAQK